MNKTVSILIGSGIGAGIGYFVGSVIVEYHKVKEEFNEQVLEEDQPLEEKGKIMGKSGKKNKDRKRHDYTTHFSLAERPELALLVKKYEGDGSDEPTDDEDAEEEDTEFEVPEDGTDDSVMDPSIISIEEYASNDNDFAVTILLFYDDDVVTDENHNPIAHPEQLLGEDALVSFGELSNDPNTVYVRNNAKKALYEVIKRNKNFGEKRPVRQALSKRSPKEKEFNDEEANKNDVYP